MNQRLTILGAGESGIGAAILGKQKHYDVFVSDRGMVGDESKQLLEQYDISYEEGAHSDKIYACDLVVKSPGIPDGAPPVKRLMDLGIEVISEIEFAFRFMNTGKIVAITGTNGKTTTTLITHHLLQAAGYNVALGGNIGISLAKLVAEGNYDYYVVEVSSFQLDGIVKFKPDVAILLNITPDHLDRYQYDFKNYVRSKFRIIENLTKEECFIYSADSSPITAELAHRKLDACRFAISASQSSASAFLDKDHLIFDYQFKNKGQHHKIPLTDISLIGKHNMLNVMAGVLAGLNLDVPIEKIIKGLKTFKNVEHRLERLEAVEGVSYINDSKATNVDAVFYALEGIHQQIIWLVGGIDKGNDYTQLQELVNERVKHIVCIGEDNSPVKKVFEGAKPIVEASSMEQAVVKASQLAESGDVVLLSPACSSFDRFVNYEDRGRQFKEAVQALRHQKQLSHE